MKFMFTALVTILFSLSVFADGKSHYISFTTEDKEKISVLFVEYVNLNNELEIRIEATGAPRFAKNINPILGYARDLDDNGKIDTWFLLRNNGVRTIQMEGNDRLGRDIINHLFKKEFDSTLGLYLRTSTIQLFKHLLISTSEAVNKENGFYKDWIDLKDSEIRFSNLQKNSNSSVTYEQIINHYNVQSAGYEEMASQMNSFIKREFWLLNGADLALYATGGVILKWLGSLTSKLGRPLTQSQIAILIQEKLYTFGANHLSVLKGKLTTLKETINTFKKASASSTVVLASRIHWRDSNAILIKAMRSKNILASSLAKSLYTSAKFSSGALSQWRYVGINMGVQITAESLARYEDIYSNDPLVMGKNILTNEDVQRNVSFMTASTILMTGAGTIAKTTKGKFALGAFLALTNSAMMNLIVHEDDDYTRMAFDTSWEVLIGNTQVQLDLLALAYFESLSQKMNNPKIKLLGYAVVLLDMGGGYFGYSKATELINESQTTILVPVFVEK